jgi:hypothetical protein
MRALTALVDFAGRRPGAYLASCCAIGLVIRWYWLGQDIHRFVDPLAPIFR